MFIIPDRRVLKKHVIPTITVAWFRSRIVRFHRFDYNAPMTERTDLNIVFLDASTIDRGDISFEKLTSRWDCVFHDRTSPDDLAGRLDGMNVAVTNKVIIDKEAMSAVEASRLELIAIAATGTNNVDLSAAAERGLPVCNVAGYSTDSVVQQTFAYLMHFFSNVAGYAEDVRGGEWEKSPIFTMLTRPVSELSGKTIGIVGLGAIGGGVAKAAEALGMRVLVAQRPGSSKPVPPGRMPLDKMLPQLDILSLHCPLTPQTENLIGEAELSKMKPSAYIVNVARGGIVDEQALVQALRMNRLAGAAFDVLTSEPPPPDQPLIAAAKELDNLIVTPHTAWSSIEARQRLVDEIAENISAYFRGENRNRVA